MLIICMIKNELFHLENFIAKNLERNEIVFVDDFSSDGSYEFISERKFDVVRNSFQSFASQRNFALFHFKNKIDANGGVLFLDADEWLTEDLRIFLENNLKDKSVTGYFSIPPRNLLCNLEIPRSSGFPVYHDRFFKAPVHGEFKTVFGGHIEKFEPYNISYARYTTNYYYMHDAYSRGGKAWLIKHINLARLETINHLNKSNMGRKYKALTLSRQLYLSPLIRFCYHFFFKLGFTEGKRGLLYAIRYVLYELMIIENRLEKEVSDGED